MTICAVVGCKSSNDKRRIKNPNNYVEVSFCRFPKDETLQKLWLSKCGRSNIKSKPNTLFICLKHFKPEDYARNLRHELLNYFPKSRRKIKVDAIPSLFLPESVENNVSASFIISDSEDNDVASKLMDLSEKCLENDRKMPGESYVVVVDDPTSEKNQTNAKPPKTSQGPCSDPAGNIEDFEIIQLEFIDHVVMVYLNRCRSRAGHANVGMPAYILRGKAEEAAILLGTQLENRFHWLDEFKKKLAASDAKGVVLTRHPESLSIADIICDEWPKFAKQKGLGIGGDDTEEKQTQNSNETGNVTLTFNLRDDQTQSKELGADDSKTISPAMSSPTAQKQVQNRDSQEGFLRHVLMVFINRFKATWPQADIPDIILSSKFREAAMLLGTQIKNRNVWFCAFKLGMNKKPSSDTIFTSPDQSLEINHIIEEERLKYKFENELENIVKIEKNTLAAGSEIESDEDTLDAFEHIKVESSDAFEEIHFESTDTFKQIKAEISDEFEQINGESSDIIETYEEARDCLNMLNNYALEIADLSAFELIMQVDLFLGSEDYEG